MRRIKANDKISFPAALDMSPFLAGESSAPTSQPCQQPAPDSQASILDDASAQQYELAAILVHKGGSATQGHYGGSAFAAWSLAPVVQAASWAL